MTELEKNITLNLSNLQELHLDVQRDALTFPINANEPIIDLLESLDIATELSGIGVKEIGLNEMSINIFFNEADFLARVNRNSWRKSIFLIRENIFFSIDTQQTFIHQQIKENYFLISNNFYCYKFFAFLKTQEHQENSAFYFVDYLNWDTYHLVLTSLKKDGKVEITLPKIGVNISENVNLSNAVSEFISAFNENNKHFPKFIKTELIAVISKIEKSKRLETLLLKLNEIMYVASQNFEIYIHDLSLENLKKEFIEHKNKYFLQLRDVLSKLTNQIIGLPIAIGTSVFSTYKVSDSTSTLFLVLSVFFLYAFYTIFLLKLQKEDIQDIRISFKYDFSKIKDSEFFLKFPSELKEFDRIKGNLDSRIVSLILAINVYFLFFSLSIIAFAVYVENQMKISQAGMLGMSILIAILLLTIYIYNETLRKE